jgi:hypothetical protein
VTLAFAGIIAGFAHVVSGPDHLAAIAPYAVAGKVRAWRTGVRWGFGHSAGVIAVGLLAVLFRDALQVDALSAWGERCVGLVLIAIGVRGLRTALAVARRSHAATPPHRHAPFAIGTVHGLAGSSHLLGVVPALMLPSELDACIYLVLFGVASIAAMGAFSSFVGWFADRRFGRGAAAQSALLATCSVAAVVVGCFWLLAQLWPTTASALA